MEVTDRDRWFLRLARTVSEASTCAKKKVGCVLVCENRIVATGYNGTPPGMDHCQDMVCWRDVTTDPDVSSAHRMWSTTNELHAELNALLQPVSRSSRDVFRLYNTYAPCVRCAMAILGYKNIEMVFFSDANHRDESGVQLLRSKGVVVVHVKT